ncbi:MAG: mycothiol system anti-sigma-R factor [Candidatus Zixiibacteriota bacterium]
MNCREALAKLYDYLDSELTTEENNQIKTHLDVCDHCLEKYKLEEDFNKLVKQKVKSKSDVVSLKAKVLAEIEKIDRGIGGSAGGRNVIFLIVPIAAAAILTLFLVNPFSSQGSVLEVVYPFATEHDKCLDHVMQYLVQSQDPIEVKAAFASFGDVPAVLFQAPHSDFRLAGAALSHTEFGERPHIDYNFDGTDVSIFVLNHESLKKSAFRQIQHNGKTFYVGACPKFHYVIWESEKHECIAVSKLGEDRLLGFASTF